MVRRRLAAIGFLVLAPLTLLLTLWVAAETFPDGLILLACVIIALLAAAYAMLRTGIFRVIALAVGAVALSLALILITGHVAQLAVIAIGVLACVAAAGIAFRTHVQLPAAPPPRQAVLFMNPRSGGGKAERFSLASQARSRGIEPIELKPGDDLEVLVRTAVANGADGLAMAGGDGSQAIVAAIAAETGLPYACIPAGTRNHFALDLGVDRDDVVGALDAFVDGGEHRVDLGVVNGRVFVNNVSLGLYAEAVQRAGYREAKVRTLLATVPDVIGPQAQGLDLRWQGPDGQQHETGAVIMVSNNRYRLGHAIASGTRPHIDDGLLGVTVVGAPARAGERPARPMNEWSTPTFEVHSEKPIPAGIDGEAVVLQSPVRFGIRPQVLRARISAGHPGASPSALTPAGRWQVIAALARIAVSGEVAPRQKAAPTAEAAAS